MNHSNSKNSMHPVGITMGCPAGIGPEIILKFFCKKKELLPEAIVIGTIEILQETAKQLGLEISFSRWTPGTEVNRNTVNVLDMDSAERASVIPGQPNRQTGTMMAGYIEKAVELYRNDFLSGIATCPISKTSLNDAGYNFHGHTEFLCSLTDADQAVMMMAGNRLNIILATIHCSLASVPSMISRKSLENLISLTDRTLKIDFGRIKPRIAVAGLNPHAGENGLFGDEELTTITPAVKNTRHHGIDVRGPFPPDTVFNRAASGEFDAVVCMYHDQGLIPFKLLHFVDGVNVTLGIPIVRTSVDHGTAYDIAGKGLADYRSLEAAVTLAASIAQNRQKYDKAH